jgi:hypothetical protein
MTGNTAKTVRSSGGGINWNVYVTFTIVELGFCHSTM